MSDSSDKEWRIQRLKAFAQKLGGNKPAGIALGWKDGAFIGQMINGVRPITEKTIENIEAMDGFSGWFGPRNSWPFPGIDPSRFHDLTVEQKAEIRGMVKLQIQQFETANAEIRKNGTHS